MSSPATTTTTAWRSAPGSGDEGLPGALSHATTWRDPEFKANQRAAYYVRVLEIPTPRWSTILAVKSGIAIPDSVAPTIQERAWSSPIWYTPKS